VQLSKRLYAIAECVPKESKVVDVGTDHAHIPIYLMRNSRAASCIATDINRGPLEKARLNMKTYGVHTIDLRLANGLKGIKEDEADVIIIAGMGGYLIIDILENSPQIVKEVKKLILQPQQDIPLVRKFLHTIGFKIEDEKFIEEDGKYYTIIVAALGNEAYEKDYEYEYGKILIHKKTETFKEYILRKQDKLTEIYQNISQIDTEYTSQRKKELEKETRMHKEVMQCIF
jgi:tRNA (adenine22-N1)-methyltransferase